MSYRVVQWATGGVGGSALGAIIDHPDLELVGVYVHSAEKSGVDAGSLVGRADTGVIATSDKDAILSLDADVVIHAPLGQPTTEEYDRDVSALLRSGKNVISTAAYGYPWLFGEEYVGMLESACAEGGATLYGTGLDPDLISRIPVLISSMCTKVESVRITEICYMATNPNPGLMVDTIGFGKRPEEINPESDGSKYLAIYLPQILFLLNEHFGFGIDRIEPVRDLILAERDFTIACTEIKQGTMAAAHLQLNAYSGDDKRLTIEFYWTVDKELGDFPKPDDQYRWIIDIDGKPAVHTVMDVGVSLTPGLQYDEQAGFYATAAIAVNAIPEICAAAPGVFKAPVFAPAAARMAAPTRA